MHGSRLRLLQVTPADSGEYVCRVVGSSGTQEASVLVTIQQRLSGSHCECLGGHANGRGLGGPHCSLSSSHTLPSILPSQPRAWHTLSASSPPQPPWPTDTPWTSTAWLPARLPIPSPGISVEAAYPAGTRYRASRWGGQKQGTPAPSGKRGNSQNLTLCSFSHSTNIEYPCWMGPRLVLRIQK